MLTVLRGDGEIFKRRREKLNRKGRKESRQGREDKRELKAAGPGGDL